MSDTSTMSNWEYEKALDTTETQNWENENDLASIETQLWANGAAPDSPAMWAIQEAQDDLHYDQQWAIDDAQFDAHQAEAASYADPVDYSPADAYQGFTETGGSAFDWDYANDYGDYSQYTGAYDDAGTYDAASCSMISDY